MNSIVKQEISYRMLKLLSQKADLTQRQMAGKMGISLGKVNYCLAALAECDEIKHQIQELTREVQEAGLVLKPEDGTPDDSGRTFLGAQYF